MRHFVVASSALRPLCSALCLALAGPSTGCALTTDSEPAAPAQPETMPQPEPTPELEPAPTPEPEPEPLAPSRELARPAALAVAAQKEQPAPGVVQVTTQTLSAIPHLTGLVQATETGQRFGFLSFDLGALPSSIYAFTFVRLHGGNLAAQYGTLHDLQLEQASFDQLGPAAISAGPGLPIATLFEPQTGSALIAGPGMAFVSQAYAAQAPAPRYAQCRFELVGSLATWHELVASELPKATLELGYLTR